MPLRSRKTVDIPGLSVPSYVFGHSFEPLANLPIILDAEHEDRYLTLSTYRQHAQHLAHGLRQAGLRSGDKLMSIGPGSLAYPVLIMGIWMAGGVLSAASFIGKDEILAKQAAEMQPRFIFASPGYESKAEVMADAAGMVRSDIILFEAENLFATGVQQEKSTRSTHKHWQSLLASDRSQGHFDWTQTCSHDSLALINFTSGSTGDPKGVMITHRNLVANACSYIELQKDDIQGPEAGNPMNTCQSAPFNGNVAQNQVCILGPKRGVRNYVSARLDLELMLSYVAKYRSNTLGLPPSLLIALLSSPLGRKHDLSSVRNVLCGGAPLRLATSKRFEEFMPHPECRVLQGWGMTEVTLCVIFRHPNDREQTSSVGELLPNAEAKVMSPDGLIELGPDEAGEIYIRSPNVAQGYYQRSEATAATFLPDGWLRTGDLGYYDERRRWFISDRVQHLIWTSDGRYVMPTDIETGLLDVEGVIDAGVAPIHLPGASHPIGRAFVVLDGGSTASRQDVHRSFASLNPDSKMLMALQGGIFVVHAIPRLPGGKVDRVALRHLPVDG